MVVVIAQPDSFMIDRMRWQGRPAAIIVMGTPRDPTWTPGVIRRPNPRVAGRTKPASIMEWRPSRMGDGNGGLPAPSITGNEDPGTVRRKGGIKIAISDGGRFINHGWRL